MPRDSVVLKIQRQLCTRNAPEKFRDFWETGPWAKISTTINYSVNQWMDGIISPLNNLAPAFNRNKTTKKNSLISVPDEKALPTRMATSSLLLNTDITALTSPLEKPSQCELIKVALLTFQIFPSVIRSSSTRLTKPNFHLNKSVSNVRLLVYVRQMRNHWSRWILITDFIATVTSLVSSPPSSSSHRHRHIIKTIKSVIIVHCLPSQWNIAMHVRGTTSPTKSTFKLLQAVSCNRTF